MEKERKAPIDAQLFVLDLQIKELNGLYFDFIVEPTKENAKTFLDRYNEVFMPVEYDESQRKRD